MIDPRVITQARGQKNMSKALKWGIVHLCASNTFGDTTNVWKYVFFNICVFVKNSNFTIQNRKNWKLLENSYFLFSSYLQNHLSYRDMQYLILKPLTHCLTIS